MSRSFTPPGGVRTRVLAGLMVIGAGFNGASFLDFNDNTSSLIMSLLALGAIASYTIALSVPP